MIKQSIPTVLGFIVIWSLLLIVDRSVIGTNYANSVHDVGIGWFSWMLNWSTGDPRLIWYTPALTSRILNGLVAFFVDIDFTERPIIRWLLIGTCLQGALVIVVGVWVSWIARLLRLDWLEKSFLCLVFLCYPTLLVYTGHWGVYFEYWLLGLPIGLALFAVFKGEKSAVPSAGAGCGFLIANSYPSAIIIFAIFFVMVIRKMFFNTPSYHRETRHGINHFKMYVAGWLALCAVAWAIAVYFSDALHFSSGQIRVLVILICTLVGWFLCVALVLILVRLDSFMESFLLWGIAGFVISSSILLPWYWSGLLVGFDKTIAIWQSIGAIWFRLPTNPWYAVLWCFIVFLLGVAVFQLWKKLIRRQPLDEPVIGQLIFSILGVGCVILIAGATDDSMAGGPERGLIAMAPCFAAGCLLVNRCLGHQWRIMFIIPMVVLSAYSVFHFYSQYSIAVAEMREEGRNLDEAITTFLDIEPQGSVVCVSDEFNSKYCAAAYAYNRYRTNTSLKNMPTWRLFDGRIISLNAQMPDLSGNWNAATSEVEQRLLPIKGPLLIITEGGEFRNALLEIFATHDISLMPFWRWWTIHQEAKGKMVTNIAPGEAFIAGLDY